jgi:SAM-dependent methyltransferase
LEAYYDKRAAEYEEVYARDDPVARRELDEISAAVEASVNGRRILEVACGTGFWTRPASRSARSVSAMDVSKEMLEIARRKEYSCRVSFQRGDAYAIPFRPGSFDGGFANFWLSHVPRARLGAFLEGLHGALVPKSTLFFADNVFVPRLGEELVSRGEDKNSYKLRKLRDGSQHLVLKNYFSKEELEGVFGALAGVDLESLDVFHGERYWHVRYQLGSG